MRIKNIPRRVQQSTVYIEMEYSTDLVFICILGNLMSNSRKYNYHSDHLYLLHELITCMTLNFHALKISFECLFYVHHAGVSKDGQIRHFFHRPAKAYATGTRKRRRVHKSADERETRWHKTGKTRSVLAGRVVKGFKKILVLYNNYGRQRKPEKTNWVMHQYHLGKSEEERDGELVVSKVFHQTQPRRPSSTNLREPKDTMPKSDQRLNENDHVLRSSIEVIGYNSNSPCDVSYDQLFIPNFAVHGEAAFLDPLTEYSNKGKLVEYS